MPVLPLAGFMSGMIAHRIREIHEETEREIKNRKKNKPVPREIFTSDFNRTVDAHIMDRMYDLKKATNEIAGIRECAYMAACEIDRDLADELLAELNSSILHKGNYFKEDNWEWPLAAMEFKSEFCHRIFSKYETCYWDELSKKLEDLNQKKSKKEEDDEKW